MESISYSAIPKCIGMVEVVKHVHSGREPVESFPLSDPNAEGTELVTGLFPVASRELSLALLCDAFDDYDLASVWCDIFRLEIVCFFAAEGWSIEAREICDWMIAFLSSEILDRIHQTHAKGVS